MPDGKRLTWTGDLICLAVCAVILGAAAWSDIAYHNQAACERAEAVNDAYMRGFRAGQIEGVQESIERIEAATARVNENTRQP